MVVGSLRQRNLGFPRLIDPITFSIPLSAILIDPVTVHIGKPAIMAAMARWFGAGMRKADPAHDPVSMIPYRAMAKINYDFSGLPSEAPVAKTTQGTVIVDVEPGSGLIMRIAALPHEESNRKWSSDLVNWLVQQQIKQAQQAA